MLSVYLCPCVHTERVRVPMHGYCLRTFADACILSVYLCLCVHTVCVLTPVRGYVYLCRCVHTVCVCTCACAWIAWLMRTRTGHGHWHGRSGAGQEPRHHCALGCAALPCPAYSGAAFPTHTRNPTYTCVNACIGSKQFLSSLKEDASAGGGGARDNIIGQFGVGFYSAFMVADHITVVSRPALGDGPGAPAPLPHRRRDRERERETPIL
jgi:hypothetical protein